MEVVCHCLILTCSQASQPWDFQGVSNPNSNEVWPDWFCKINESSLLSFASCYEFGNIRLKFWMRNEWIASQFLCLNQNNILMSFKKSSALIPFEIAYVLILQKSVIDCFFLQLLLLIPEKGKLFFVLIMLEIMLRTDVTNIFKYTPIFSWGLWLN